MKTLLNAVISAVVALVVGLATAYFTVAAPAGNLGAAIPTGDTVTNLQNFANDLNVTGSKLGATTTVRISSPKVGASGCIQIRNASTSQTWWSLVPPTNGSGTSSAFWVSGQCK